MTKPKNKNHTFTVRVTELPGQYFVTEAAAEQVKLDNKSEDELKRMQQNDADNAALLSAAPALQEALYYLGGGSLFIEEYGRLCFCPAHGKGKQHSTACDSAWRAYQLCPPFIEFDLM